MKIIFIGVHNKPKMQPLDSKTVSGKTVDAIIKELGLDCCIKVNLFDLDYLPTGDEAKELVPKFFERVEVCDSDIAVLLGNYVQYRLEDKLNCSFVKAAHPSLQYSKIGRPQYILNTAKAVREAWEKTLKPAMKFKNDITPNFYKYHVRWRSELFKN